MNGEYEVIEAEIIETSELINKELKKVYPKSSIDGADISIKSLSHAKLKKVWEYLEHSCDVGRQPNLLKKDFPNHDFSHINKYWWNNDIPINEKKINHETINELDIERTNVVNDIVQKYEAKIEIRGASGGGTGAAAQHSQSLESWFCHVPGLKVVTPSE